MIKVLVVDDDKNTREMIKSALEKLYYVETSNSAENALELVKHKSFDIIISDYNMYNMSGLEFLEEIKKRGLNAYFILITAYGTGDLAIKSIQSGAYEYLNKPFKISELKSIISKIEKRMEETNKSDKRSECSYETPAVIAYSQSYLNVLKEMAKVADTDIPILILGESGAGKEVLAKMIHEHSKRSRNNYIAINCNAIPETLMESELFGYEKGSFTGADKTKTGLLEQANGGTFFFDEIGDLTLDLQVKLLRVLQENKIRRIGGKTEIPLNVRFIFATNVDLEKKIEQNQFRIDLYYRIKVATLKIPPLRERREDILPLADYFVRKYANTEVTFSSDAKKFLLKYDYPGNIRELENIIRQALVKIRDTGIIMKEDIISGLEEELGDKKFNQIKREDIIEALKRANYNKSVAAELLKIGRSTLYRLIDKYNIDITEA